MCGHKAAVSWEADVCVQEPAGHREGVWTEIDAWWQTDGGWVPLCLRCQSCAGEDLGETGRGFKNVFSIAVDCKDAWEKLVVQLPPNLLMKIGSMNREGTTFFKVVVVVERKALRMLLKAIINFLFHIYLFVDNNNQGYLTKCSIWSLGICFYRLFLTTFYVNVVLIFAFD